MTELNFIILKINGIDVSHLPQNEAVQMFLKASEPILLEVRRKLDGQHKYADKSATDVTDEIHTKLGHLKIATGATTSIATSLATVAPSPAAALQTGTATLKCNSAKAAGALGVPLHTTTAAAGTNSSENEMLTLKLTPPTSVSGQTETATGNTGSTTTTITSNTSGNTSAKSLSRATQTDDNNFYSLHQHPDDNDLHQRDHDQQQHSAKETTDRLIEQEHNLFEQCLAPEIDIEEITLRKSDSNERLGLTVCYSGYSNGSGNNNGALSGSDDNETCTEVYISDIQPDSIADRDGRLRQGDQILQINGKDIKNKEETESLIAENNNAVTLLVSRYLYTDEDDFNDPSVADLDVVDDDDDEEEYYDENNLAYENCFITNDYINVVDELDKVLLAQASMRETERSFAAATASAGTAAKTFSEATVAGSDKTNATTAKDTSSSKVKVPGRGGDGEQVLNAFANSDQGTAQHKTHAKKDNQSAPAKPVNAPTTMSAVALVSATSPAVLSTNYDTEHIYETIPEDSESEPFYCSPYESSMYVTAVGSCSSAAAGTSDAFQLQQQKQRVAQWLGIKPPVLGAAPSTVSTTAPRQSVRSSSGCGRSLAQDAAYLFTRTRNGTVRSAITMVTNGSSSSGGCGGAITGGGAGGGNNNNILMPQNDEHENSSSAYNTGGSNNSVAPLILVLNHNNRGDGLSCSLGDVEQVVASAGGRGSKAQRLQSPKDKITSPKNSAMPLAKGSSGTGGGPHAFGAASTMDAQQQQLSQKTMYTNEANLHQTMLLQQHLFRQALTYQQQQQHQQEPLQQQLHCPQFTAPNLSQYHFVSSQEVSSAHINAAPATVVLAPKNPNEEAMVWKVKRRPDGTRYIVRRPARNRLVRDRSSVRLNTERVRNDFTTTTEDDTISEVKTGRYWSKEERKKHIERARERRQQHQQQQQQLQQQLESAGPLNSHVMTTMRIGDKAEFKLQQRERTAAQQLRLLQKQPNARSTRPSAAKSGPQQHYQLQFSSGTPPPQSNLQPQYALTTAIPSAGTGGVSVGTGAVIGVVPSSTDAAAKAAFLPSKSISSNLHICSPVDAPTAGVGLGAPPSTTSAAGAAPVAAAATAPAVSTDAAFDAAPGATQSFQPANDTSKLSNLLSVTTV